MDGKEQKTTERPMKGVIEGINEGLEIAPIITSKDKNIVSTVVNIISESRDLFLTEEKKVEALDYLWHLIPVKKPDGNTYIANRLVNDKQMKLIMSRRMAKEVDVVSENGVWGRLPKEVKETIIKNSNIAIQLTDNNCTVGCSFCGVSHYGPIEEKMSLMDSVALIREILYEKINNGMTNNLCLYGNNDSLDARWNHDGHELDIGDVIYNVGLDVSMISKKEIPNLLISTAIPLGEEIRLLGLIIAAQKGMFYPTGIRMSIRQENLHVFLTLNNVLKGIFPRINLGLRVEGLYVNDCFDGNIFPSRIRDWKTVDNENSHTTEKIKNISCEDMVIISPKKVESVCIQGASWERPSGMIRQSLENENGIYQIPKALYPRQTSKVDVVGRYIKNMVIKYDKNNKLVSQEEIEVRDPHRAMWKIIIDKKNGRRIDLEDIKLVEEHLTGLKEKGLDNKTMRWVLENYR